LDNVLGLLVFSPLGYQQRDKIQKCG